MNRRRPQFSGIGASTSEMGSCVLPALIEGSKEFRSLRPSSARGFAPGNGGVGRPDTSEARPSAPPAAAAAAASTDEFPVR